MFIGWFDLFFIFMRRFVVYSLKLYYKWDCYLNETVLHFKYRLKISKLNNFVGALQDIIENPS